MSALRYIWHCENCGRQGESINRLQRGDRVLCIDCDPGLRAALGLPPLPPRREVLQELFDDWYQARDNLNGEFGMRYDSIDTHLEAVRYALFLGLTPPDVEKHWIEVDDGD